MTANLCNLAHRGAVGVDNIVIKDVEGVFMRRRNLLVVALMSVTLLSLELVWTRLFSAEFFYTYAFLTLSLAVLGLGIGALALRLFPSLYLERNVGVFLAIAGGFALLGPPTVFRLGLDFSSLFTSLAMIGRFVLTLVLLGAPFFFGGVALAMLFKHDHENIHRLYAADLIGAGIGVLLAIVLMNQIGTPAAVFWVAFPILFASFISARWWFKIFPVVLVAALVMMAGRADGLLEAPREEHAPVVYKHWDAMAKVKMYCYGEGYRVLNVDNVAHFSVIPFDGDWGTVDEELGEEGWDIDVRYLIDRFDSCTFLSLGSGGGSDVFQALQHGATEIHAVEVNPHINRMMLEGDPSGYLDNDSCVVDSTGRLITCDEVFGFLYKDPRVKVVSEDARTYVRRHKNKFDIIFSLSSNTWAALGSGSFALAESYLFTTEAFMDYWEALTDDGFLSMEHQVYMPRLVAELLDALDRLGVDNPTDHFAVYNLPTLRRNLLLLSKTPLTDEVRQRAYLAMSQKRYDFIYPLYPAPDSVSTNIINQIVTGGWESAADSAAVNLSPCTDDRPFVAQMGMWKNLERDRLKKVNTYAEFYGFPLSKIIIYSILAVVVVLMIPLMLLPYVLPGRNLRAGAWLYFFVVGIAFMAVEVILIQKYALFIGASVYSIATVLLTLLVASGIGSRLADRVGARAAFLGIIVWLLLEVSVLGPVTGVLVGMPMLARAVIAAALVFPLGFFMGIPFPMGARRVGDLVDWGFAVNGAASVLGATAIVLVAFAYGFTVALLVAAGLYLIAGVLLSIKANW
ncbi:MAG: hypothetical protein JSW50_02330 [Candidatus Latescibacterota bacterium]|nr:MAG: hypothetical protein JSW50_02330 [Candidatus Latescibacterota bacterium]